MSKRKPKAIEDGHLEESSKVLRALAHPLRMRILAFIDQHETIHVNHIYNTLNLEQSITSQHLRILRVAGLVETERQGKFVHYRIAYQRLRATLQAVHNFLKKGDKEE